MLAEKAHISRGHLSAIEAPGMAHSFSLEAFFNIADALEAFFNIADALEVDPADLIHAAVFPDKLFKGKQTP